MYAALFIAALAIMQTPLPMTREATQQPGSASHKAQTNSKDNAAPAKQSVPVKQLTKPNEPQKNAPVETKQNDVKSEPVRVAPVDVHKDWADYLSIIATLFLTLATLAIAIYAVVQAHASKAAADAAGKTLAAIQRQSDLMDRQITLQEAAMRQWVTIGKWSAQEMVYENGNTFLIMEYRIVNPTNRPLTLKAVSTFITCAMPILQTHVLPPREAYIVSFLQQITAEQLNEWREGSLALGVTLKITYEDVLEKKRLQSIAGIIRCSKMNGVTFSQSSSRLSPEVSEVEKPNPKS